MNTSLRAAALPFLALLACLPAQEPGTDAGHSSAVPAVVPIHTGPDDPAGHGPYGYWASGPSWKASFHGGFAFYPYIPDAATTRGFRWHTESIVVGGQQLALGEPTMVTAERRCEYRFGGVTEAYDVREQGVEQTFVFDRLPAARGELVVTGRVTTPFRAPATERPRHGALAFRDETGAVVMHYGEAKVFDAAGRSTGVKTTFDGQRLSLVVDAAWMGEAQLPITVDPVLWSDFVLTTTQTACCASTAVGDDRAWYAHRRRWSATDEDAYCYRVSLGAFGVSTITNVFSDLSIVYSITAIDIAEVAGTLDVVLAMQRDYPSSPSVSVVWLQDMATTVVNSGTIYLLPAGRIDPQVGGSRGSGTQALVVSTEVLASGSRRVRGNVLNATFGVLSSSFDLHSFASSADSYDPAVTDAAVDLGNWGVAWVSAFGNPAGNDLRVAEVSQFGVPTTTRVLTVKPGLREPRLAGADHRYLAQWLHSPASTNSQISNARFDVAANTTLTGIHERVVATASSILLETLEIGDVAFDFTTRSHWASCHATRTVLLSGTTTTAFVTRHGYSGGVASTSNLYALSISHGVAHPSVAYRGEATDFFGVPNAGFVASFMTNTVPGFVLGTTIYNPVYYSDIDHPAAPTTPSGTSCRTSSDTQNHPPYAGSEFYARTVHGLPANTAAILLVGLTPVKVPLDFVGMTGCTLLVDFAWTFGALATPTGDATVTIALPDDPIFQGLLHVQWLWIDGTAPTGLVTGPGVTLDVQ